MILSFNLVMDLILNILSNIMTIDKNLIKIQLLEIQEDLDNYFYLKLWLCDTEYDGLTYHISITLLKSEKMFSIENVYFLVESENQQKITPYIFEGLTELRYTFINCLENIKFYVSEVSNYVK